MNLLPSPQAFSACDAEEDDACRGIAHGSLVVAGAHPRRVIVRV